MSTIEIETPKWELFEPPFQWTKYGLVVIGDRHLPDGRRQHIVEGVVPQGLVLDNADIFGEGKPCWREQNGND